MRISWTSWARLGWFSCSGDRLTAMLSGLSHWAASAQDLRSTHSPSGRIRPVSSASGMKSSGGGQARPRGGRLRGRRVAPTDQRLEPEDLAVAGAGLRLVMDHQVLVDDRLAQLAGEVAPFTDGLVHLALEEAVGAA